MKFNNFYYQSLFLLAAFLLTGCGVNNDPLDCTPQFTGELLDNETKLIGQWNSTGAIADVEVDLTNDNIDNPSFNMFKQYSECAQDAIFYFDENRTYAYDLGTLTFGCTRSNTVGTWKLSSGELFLIVNCDNISYDLSFNEDSSQFEYTTNVDVQEVNGSLTSANVIFTFSKIEP